MHTKEQLQEFLSYSPYTGVFHWRVHVSRKMRAGKVAGTNSHGYVRIKIIDSSYPAHRIAWLFHTGAWPEGQIDHINGVRSDNRISNLRPASNAENHQNLPRLSTNKSGYTGVSWQKGVKKWQACIGLGGKTRYLGTFDDPRDAHSAYLAAKAELHTFNPVPRQAP